MARYTYEKWDLETGKKSSVSEYTIDTDRSITGRIAVNVKAWFDENPEEWKKRGWIKHIMHDKPSEVGVEYNAQTQNLIVGQKQIDPYTVEDIYYVEDKSEEQMLLEEMLESIDGFHGRSMFFEDGGVLTW